MYTGFCREPLQVVWHRP